MEIRNITAQATYPLRQLVLRPNQPLQACAFVGDDEATTYHFAGVIEHECLVIATCVLTATGYQIRGVASHPNYQNQGLGTQFMYLLDEAMQQKSTAPLWCNARIKAQPFYERLGFVKVGDPFLIDPIGWHQQMVWVNRPSMMKK